MCSSCTGLLNNIARCPRPTNPQEGISCQDTPADTWQLNFWVHHKPDVRKMGSLGESQMCGLYSVFFQNYIYWVNGLQKNHSFSSVPEYLIWAPCNELECIIRAGYEVVSPSGYISKCGSEIVLRPSDNFIFSKICVVSGELSNWDQKLYEKQKLKHSWHFRRYKMKSGRDEAKLEANQDLLLTHCRKCCQEHEGM